jgi:UDP-N-acetylmuramate: L-alanyl-gamma-D-glutamyl-meso-diaminopimelate ligase
VRPGDHVLIMSNGGFGGLHQRLLDALTAREADHGGYHGG